MKESKGFRDLLVNLFQSLINVFHETEVLYTDEPLMENIARWVYTMSSSTLRPFRHTSTTIALAMELALAGVARKLDDRITKTTQQIEAAKKGRTKNKDMLATLQQNLDETNSNREICGKYVLDCFDVVFVHRYRDVDARIRTECIEALGSWIWVLPTMFMEPEYLRYLGWLLSDVTPSARQEVLKQLARVFKRDASKLGHFIDRFRPRLMEMATRDSDVGVRVAAISVVETLGEAGMLEPDEVDATGKLIFDSELRVRKAAVKFLVDVVASGVESKIEGIGGEEAIDELFPESEDVDILSPRREWLEVKALAETLAIYDASLEDEEVELRRGIDVAADLANAIMPETRISLASQVLYEKMEIVKNWETISGYLLHDHTTSTKSKSKGKASSSEVVLRNNVAPEAQEEAILLQVLASAVKQSLAHSHEAEKGKKKPARGDVAESAEEVALNLAKTIPKLLKKYGAEPSTATTVLRLEHFLDLDVFQQLRQDSATYERLLDEICTQFNRHVDKGVVAESARALLHSRRYEELEEMADIKIAGLQETVINSLRNFDKSHDLSVRLNMEGPVLTELSNSLMKISQLAQISPCIDVLEAQGPTDDSKAPAIEILAKMVHRGRFQQVDLELDDLEDEVTSLAIRSCHFYFMWKTRSIIDTVEMQTDISKATIDRLAALRKTYQANLIHTLSSRAINDDLRLFATGSLCDLHILLASIRHSLDQWQAAGAAKKYAGLLVLTPEIQPGLIPELISVFDGAERAFARKARKALNEPAEDEDPIDDDGLSDDEDEDGLSHEEKRAGELIAEKALCELTARYVMAILSRVLDQTPPGKLKKRLLRNATKLGPNYRDTVAHLDEKKMAAKGKRRAAKSKPAAAPAKPALSAEIVVADDSDEEEPFAEPEEGTEEDLRRRELLEDPIVDDDDELSDAPASNGMDAEDDILGD